jgi:hypothetical protein
VLPVTIPQAFARIATAFSAAGLGPFHRSRVITTSGAVYDDGGSIVTPGQVLQRDCMIQVDSVTEAMRAQEGYTDRDVRLLVLSATLAGVLDTAATVDVLEGPNQGVYSLQTCVRDPMGVYWECRGRAA